MDAGLQSKRESHLKAIFISNGFEPLDGFWSNLVAQLEKDGYAVVPIAVSRDRSDFLKQLPSAPEPIAAYFDVVVQNYGYMAAGIGSENPYRPFLILNCKLVRVSDSAILMQDSVAVNPLNTGSGWLAQKLVTISPDPAFAFPGMDEITNNPKQAIEGTKSAFAQSTEAVGKLLR
ncbi:MAG TPA: hypothetical protein VHT03_06905 [Rhizomicrobium sp.]|nr:hypothetical protein [Rhizomicrobium sp.]